VNEQSTSMYNNQNYPFDQASMLYSQSQVLKLVTDEHIKEVKSDRRTIENFLKSLNGLSVHDARSLLFIDNILSGNSLENLDYDDDDYKNILISHLINWPSPIGRYNFLIECKAKNQIPEKYLEWFKNDLRCSLFLTSLVSHLLNAEAYKGRYELIDGITNLLRYDIIKFNSNVNTDLLYSEKISKDGDWRVSFLLSFKSTYLKGRTQDKELKWLDASNIDQIEWAYSYLDNDKDRPIILQGIFFPENIEDKYDLILAHLDTLSNIETPQIGTKNNKGFSLRSYTLYKMKKAWDGRKNYDSKVQASNGNIKIYKKNQSKLKELVKYNKVATNKLVNKFIEDAYENYTANCLEGAQELDQHTSNEDNNVKGKDKTSGSTSGADTTHTKSTSAINQSKRRIPLKSRATPTARVTNQSGRLHSESLKYKEKSRD